MMALRVLARGEQHLDRRIDSLDLLGERRSNRSALATAAAVAKTRAVTETSLQPAKRFHARARPTAELPDPAQATSKSIGKRVAVVVPRPRADEPSFEGYLLTNLKNRLVSSSFVSSW